MEFTQLAHRAVFAVEGEDRLAFLQGLISNDINKANPEHAIWSGFLTPQGKFLFDLFVTVTGDSLLIETDADRLDSFVKRLTMFKLRSKVSIRTVPELSVWAAWGEGVEALFGLASQAGNATVWEGGTVAVDPRLAQAGLRLLLPQASAAQQLTSKGLHASTFDAWDVMRLGLGLPDGGRDLEVETTLLLEAGFEELAGVDFKKGCYMGQETTARTKYRKLIKRRFIPVSIEGAMPAPGTPILVAGEEVGHMRSAAQNWGLAVIKLEKIINHSDTFKCGDATLTLQKPDWAIFPESA